LQNWIEAIWQLLKPPQTGWRWHHGTQREDQSRACARVDTLVLSVQGLVIQFVIVVDQVSCDGQIDESSRGTNTGDLTDFVAALDHNLEKYRLGVSYL
jgi:hypothetical protein